MKLQISDIPEDLFNILMEDEICCGTFSPVFDSAMLEHGFFEHGSLRRSHRIITEKANALTTDEITSILTGISIKDLIKRRDNSCKQEEIKEMFRIAEKYGFKLIEG